MYVCMYLCIYVLLYTFIQTEFDAHLGQMIPNDLEITISRI